MNFILLHDTKTNSAYHSYYLKVQEFNGLSLCLFNNMRVAFNITIFTINLLNQSLMNVYEELFGIEQFPNTDVSSSDSNGYVI